jgi:large subunit ribosomal protein L2
MLLGYTVPVKNLFKFAYINNIKNVYNNKPAYAKSSGTFGIIVDYNFDLQLVLIKLPTNQKKLFSIYTYVTVGRNSNLNIKYQIKGKAGINRILGCHPITRGVAMNPVDHPHGGRTKTNKPEVSL